MHELQDYRALRFGVYIGWNFHDKSLEGNWQLVRLQTAGLPTYFHLLILHPPKLPVAWTDICFCDIVSTLANLLGRAKYLFFALLVGNRWSFRYYRGVGHLSNQQKKLHVSNKTRTWDLRKYKRQYISWNRATCVIVWKEHFITNNFVDVRNYYVGTSVRVSIIIKHAIIIISVPVLFTML